ncbi:MAG: SynChlorMet cassette protein ScmC [Candidatus Saganbacteria bacterium]|nr:SynChlorMet cassette protein ScmC [Candidatus Saganbacteria bacterium]
MKNKTKGYSLKLANSQQWNIIAARSLSSWLNEFARILELKENCCNDSPKLIFIKKGKKLSSTLPQFGLPNKGWELDNVGHFRIWTHNKLKHTICEIETHDNNAYKIVLMRESLRIIFAKVTEKGGFPFHCGMIERDGYAVLLSAPGSTGKSTSCKRVERPWNTRGDDSALIIPDSTGHYFAHSLPTWSDYLIRNSKNTWNVQDYYPLKGIFFLEQAKENKIIPIWAGQAAILVNHNTTRVNIRRTKRKKDEHIKERKAIDKVFHNACELAQKIPCFILQTTRTGKFWKLIEEALEQYPYPISTPPHGKNVKLYTPKILCAGTSASPKRLSYATQST